MNRSITRQRSVRALLISGIVHLCLAIIGSFLLYARWQTRMEDAIAVEFIEAKRLQRTRRTLKQPLRKRIMARTDSASEAHPRHLKLTASASLIDKTLRQSEEALLHNATQTVDDVATALPEVTTDAQRFDSRETLPESAASPFQTTAGAGVDSFRQRVKGEGGSGFHRLESTGTSEIGTVGDGAGEEGSGGDGETDSTNPFAEALKNIANHIIGTRERDKVNVVFVLDTSASMRDNIQEVAANLYSMSDAFDYVNLEYHLGMAEFSVRREGQQLQTRSLLPDVGMLRRRMQKTTMSGDEHALDALIDTLGYIDFHADADKYLILVTDEPATTRVKQEHAYAMMRAKVLNRYQLEEIRVNVLGHPEPFQQQLAEETDGLWQRIPGDIGKATSLPSTRVANEGFLKVFRDIATDIRRNGGSLLFSMEAQFEVFLEDGDIPMKKLLREFGEKGVSVGKDTRLSERATIWEKDEGELWMITDDVNRCVYTVRKEGNKLNVYTGIYPESFNISENLTAMPQRRGRRWLINDARHHRMYTIRTDKNRLNIYAGAAPGVSANSRFEPTVDIVIVLDYSRSMGGKSQAIMLGLSTLIGRLDILPIKYRIGLIRFAEAKDAIKVINGAVITPMPLNEAMLERLMEAPFGGDEHLIDAIVEGIPKVKFSPYASRFLLILTDEPTSGGYPPERAIEVCQSLGIRAYVIGHPLPNDFQTTLVKKTGGRFYQMPKHLKRGYPNQ